MDRTNGFLFVNVLCEEHNTQSTTNGYKSHLCFLIIANWNKNKGWFGCLFVYPIWMKLIGKTKDGIYKRFCFSFVPFLTLRIEKKKIGITDHISILLFCLWIRKRERKLNYLVPIFCYGIGKRKTKRRYIQHMVLFRFFIFHLAKEKTKITIEDHISIFRVLFVDRKRENDTNLPVSYFLWWNRKTKNERTVYTRTHITWTSGFCLFWRS